MHKIAEDFFVAFNLIAWFYANGLEAKISLSHFFDRENGLTSVWLRVRITAR